MFRSKLRKRGLVGLVIASSIALTLAHGNSRDPKRSPFTEKALLEGSVVPAPVRSILQRACRDCHSDNTVWPWYADVPPISWQVHRDVTRGRAFMNLSKWSEYSDDERRGFMMAIRAATQSRVMPPTKYVWMHRSAKLSDADLKALEEWARAQTIK